MSKLAKDALKLPDNLHIDALIDVGVADGTPWLYDQFPSAQLVLVDPLEIADHAADSLCGRETIVHRCAAGAQRSAATLNIELDRTSRSSLYSRTDLSKSASAIEQQVVPVFRLDTLCRDQPQGRLGIKIDTEGHELDVLKGAAGLLDRCEFILCEVSIGQRFEGGYQFGELISWLNIKGFGVADIMRVVRTLDGQPLFADILFLPRG